MTKAFDIPKQLFVEAYKRVKANKGAAGIDDESLKDFERDLKDNLYKLWNRMSSGCYFPLAVKAVAIPKKAGGKRVLGIPTVGDRIAQMVVKLVFEPIVEKEFLPDSYGYRPNKSALEAVGVTRARCWKYNWVLEFDIKGLFDNISHDRLMKAVQTHTQSRWVLLYIKRWLTAPMQEADGTEIARTQGTPQVRCRSATKVAQGYKMLSVSSINDGGIGPPISAFRCGYQTTSSGCCKEQWS